jgi:gliding motility-associated-like protein
VYVGDQLELPLTILDANGDMLSLELKTLGFDAANHRMELREKVNENGRMEAVFTWDVTCEDLDVMDDNRYEVQWVASDSPKCTTAATSTFSIAFNVKDIHSSFEHFEMPNVFTPNGDDKNEYFQMCDQPQCERQYVLPPDNCQGRFKSIEIFNRWGKSVFRDNSRDFKWSGEGMSDGVYYYVVRYTHKTIRGQLTLMR